MEIQSQQSNASFAPVIELRSGGELALSAPVAEDGPDVHALVAACPPLDRNSVYCNLLQCTHFAGTSATARRNGRLAGWVSGHIPPEEADVLFVWQVAVAEKARGLGLGRRMIGHILARPACAGVRRIKTTITPSNGASWAMFRRLARDLEGAMSDAPWLHQGAHLPAGHETEHLVTIGPFGPPPRS